MSLAMFGQFLVTFREVLEAALVLAIMFSYFKRTGRGPFSRYVWYGVFLAVSASAGSGGAVWFVYGVVPDVSKTLFEAVAAFLAVAALSSMIVWMAFRGKYLRAEMERRVEAVTARGTVFGLVTVAFIVVFREGLETVLFLTPFLVTDAVATLTGIVLGVVGAAILAYAFFMVGAKINLHNFFYFTSILLILFAGGLAGHGVHELVEHYGQIGVNLGWLSQPAYSLNVPEGSLLHDKGLVGSVLAVMFGYAVSAEWLRVIVHLAYLAVALPLVVWIYRRTR